MIDAFKGRLDDARKEIERAEKIARLPDQGNLLDQVLLTAADIYVQTGDRQQAAARLSESFRLLEAKYPESNDPSVAWRYAVWGLVNAQLQAQDGNALAAEQSLRQARAVIEKRFGPGSFYVQLVDRRQQAIKRQ